VGKGLLPALVVSQLWVGAASAETVEQSEALAWLQKIANAARELNYRGTFVYQHGDQTETSRITHFVDRTGEYEKLETLDGPRREIIRNSGEILTFYADTRVVKRERRAARKLFPALLPDQLAALTEYYQLSKGGQERIAGYDSSN
jgi:sigma-E factor negative regulatory protein RseB